MPVDTSFLMAASLERETAVGQYTGADIGTQPLTFYFILLLLITDTLLKSLIFYVQLHFICD